MTTMNDFATSYMSQSLPFGGVKDSGFDRFAGVEGLRGLCTIHSISEDRCSVLSYPGLAPLAFGHLVTGPSMIKGQATGVTYG